MASSIRKTNYFILSWQTIKIVFNKFTYILYLKVKYQSTIDNIINSKNNIIRINKT